MSVKVVVPSLGTEVTEGIIVEWLQAIGEMVTEGEPIVVVGTPKLNLEVEAPVTGTLSRIDVAPDDIVEVGATLGLIDEGGAGA
jgi:pyruvate/2-oxoglutarate dehydrogenase complex dihydrolipoamide acyltransferase (E2) component